MTTPTPSEMFVADADKSPYFKRAYIEHPSRISVSEWPSVTLCGMVKNAESCIGRLLVNLDSTYGRPYINEVAMVLNDTSDRTAEIIARFCLDKNIPCTLFEVKPESHPEFYIQDTAATYEVGGSLVGENFGGPFTEGPILANWAGARNVAWNNASACTGKWKLFLDADDVVQDPESIPGLCLLLEDCGVEKANTQYLYNVDAKSRPRGMSYRERLVRNKPEISWIYPIHEVLSEARTSHVEGNLRVVDMRDNKGQGIRIPGRNFKILYHLARKSNWEVSPRVLVNLLMETRLLVTGNTPGLDLTFADALLEQYLYRSTWPEERGWALSLMGEMYESIEEYGKAKELYERSLGEHAGTKSAFRLARACFFLGDHAGAVEAYDMGVANEVVHQALDDGYVFKEEVKILVSQALSELGRHERAKQLCAEAIVAFPDSMALRDLKKLIEERG